MSRKEQAFANLEQLEPRLLLDSSGIWHQVEADGNIYDINLTTTGVIEDLRGHPLTAAHFGGSWAKPANTPKIVAGDIIAGMSRLRTTPALGTVSIVPFANYCTLCQKKNDARRSMSYWLGLMLT